MRCAFFAVGLLVSIVAGVFVSLNPSEEPHYNRVSGWCFSGQKSLDVLRRKVNWNKSKNNRPLGRPSLISCHEFHGFGFSGFLARTQLDFAFGRAEVAAMRFVPRGLLKIPYWTGNRGVLPRMPDKMSFRILGFHSCAFSFSRRKPLILEQCHRGSKLGLPDLVTSAFCAWSRG